MKARALVPGIVASMMLLGVAGTLHVLSAGGSQDQYRAAMTLTRQIQRLASQWSAEIARVKSDPLADFDALAAFIPRMTQLKRELLTTVRGISEPPEHVTSDVNGYLDSLEAQQECIERFKTGYAVVRNSARYLPLAAASVTRRAQDAHDEEVMQGIAVVLHDMNLFLSSPSETARRRLTEQLQRLRELGVARSRALADFIAHSEVLLDNQGPTEELFHEATSSDIGDRTEQLVRTFEFELGRQALQSAWYERSMFGVLAMLALVWGWLALYHRARGGPTQALTLARRTPSVSVALPEGTMADPPAHPMFTPAGLIGLDTSESTEENDEHPLPAALSAAGATTRAGANDAQGVPALSPEGAEVVADDARVALAPAPEDSATGVEGALLQGFLARCVAEHLSASTHRIATYVDYLHEAHSRIREALHDNDGLLPGLENGAHRDEEIEAAGAFAARVRRESDSIAKLARHLACSAAVPNGRLDRDMVDLNVSVEEVLRATGAEDAARVVRHLESIPEIFASRAEIRLLFTKVIENSVHAVQELEERTGTIRVNTARQDGDILVTVIDNGMGLSAEQRSKVLRPFYTSRDGAVGIGLSLASYLARKYEGDIKINSLPGQGTVIRIRLPAGAHRV